MKVSTRGDYAARALLSLALHGDERPTSVKEIAERTGLPQPDLEQILLAVKGAGLVRSKRGISRGLSPVEAEAPAAGRVQILGRVAAGLPIEAIEAPEELDLQSLVPPDREVYALRVKGNSMIEDSIRDGDLVLVENRKEAYNGEIVVAVLPEGDATLKRFYREKDGSFRLQPANSQMQPILTREVEIRGVVLAVLRQY